MNQPYKLNLFSCLGIVIGSIIGSGIFMVPSLMIKTLPSPMMLFAVWIVSAIVSIIGGLVVIGMGKLGGQELNYSSDVDVLFVYDDEGSVFKEPPGKNKSPRVVMPTKFMGVPICSSSYQPEMCITGRLIFSNWS